MLFFGFVCSAPPLRFVGSVKEDPWELRGHAGLCECFDGQDDRVGGQGDPKTTTEGTKSRGIA